MFPFQPLLKKGFGRELGSFDLGFTNQHPVAILATFVAQLRTRSYSKKVRKYFNILILLSVSLMLIFFSARAQVTTFPLQETSPAITGQDINWNYNMGYRFSPSTDGDVTELGGKWTSGVTHTVRLYAYPAGTVLASASVTGNGSWNYTSITPVSITSGNTYVVAVRLDLQNSGYYTTGYSTPAASGGINMLGTTYRNGSNAMPTNLVQTAMYGQADLAFQPCTYGGNISAVDSSVFGGDSTTLTVSDNVGNVQWQFSEDNMNFTDISGATSATLNTGPIDTTTYYRTYITGGS